MSHPDSTIHLTQVLNPWSSESSPKTITLPPFTDHLVLHAQMVGNVSLSTYLPNQDDDYIVSFTFFGSKLCYYMPNRDSNWTIVDILFSYEINFGVIYSRKDQIFYLLTTGCSYMAALDLKKNKKNPKFMRHYHDKLGKVAIIGGGLEQPPELAWPETIACLLGKNLSIHLRRKDCFPLTSKHMPPTTRKWDGSIWELHRKYRHSVTERSCHSTANEYRNWIC
ncbi:unnamed protein product [Brassica napus]|uniref:(rape) hypothetical protein n=1 Tax=Brassica napus TaxID=3708 RepID=A0A816WSG5_BRANA|nr:unnamed protein product [Brassica napus]